ncbi:MAG: DCC1-like thiol-disulfide oxidoreductase family protein [Nevskiaceae bacterium]
MKSTLRERLLEVFATDLRTLALFRVSLGAVLLASALLRFRDLVAFHTDDGVLPRDVVIATHGPWHWSLHFLQGSALAQGLLLGAQALAALYLLLGHRTRLATFLGWLLVASVNARNPLVLSGADELLACLLFWGMFLPLGARYSMDAALSTTPPPVDNRHRSWASAALLVQVLSVYFFSALLKSGAPWWPDGTAVRMALELDRYGTAAGEWLKTQAWALSPLTYYVYLLELLGPLLALSPWGTRWLRAALMLMLMAMHAGFAVFLSLGTFPFVSLASLTALVGREFWDWRTRVDAARHPAGLKIFYDRDCGFCLKACLLLRQFLVLRVSEIAPAQDRVRTAKLMEANYSWVVIDEQDVAHLKWSAFVVLLRHSPVFGPLGRLLSWQRLTAPGDAMYDFIGRHRGRLGGASALLLPLRTVRFDTPRALQPVVAVLLFVVLLWNLATVKWVPREVAAWVAPVLYTLQLKQSWGMFAPYPRTGDGWFVIPGKLEDGTEVSVLHPRAAGVSYNKPARVAAEIGNSRWQSYQARLYLKSGAQYRLHYGRYLCRQWNRGALPGHRLESLKLVYVLERTRMDGSIEPVEQVVLWHHDCRARPAGTEAEADSPDEPD